MGLFSAIGKGIGKAAKGTIKGLGHAAHGLGNASYHTAHGTGSVIFNTIKRNPLEVGLAIGGTAAGFSAIASHNNEDPKKAALIGAGIGAGASAIRIAPGMATLGAAAVGNAATIAAGAGSLASKMVKLPEGGVNLSNLNEVKMTKLGKAVMGASILAKGIHDADRIFLQNHVGTNDGMVRTATPSLPSVNSGITSTGNIDYSNTNATGDLVFALHNNR